MIGFLYYLPRLLLGASRLQSALGNPSPALGILSDERYGSSEGTGRDTTLGGK